MSSSPESMAASSHPVTSAPQEIFLINFLDLLTLCCLSIAQPIFDISGKNLEFFAARNSDATEIVLLSIVAILLVPVLLGLVELVASMIGAKTRDYTHRVLCWLLVGLLLLPPLKLLYHLVGLGWIVITLGLAAILSEIYLRLRARGLALAYLSPVVLILPALFMFHSPMRKIVRATHPSKVEYPQVNATVPIVMVVFDEFPLTSLMDEHGQINSLRQPNIAKLAQTATWFRNASSVTESTLHSVPSIVDGLIPDPDKQLLPNAKDHPHSLFALLGGSYRMHVVENNTRLCPEDLSDRTTVGSSRYERLYSLLSDLGILYLYLVLPPDLTHSLPNITLSWKQFAVAQARMRTPAQKGQDFDQMTDWEDRPRVFTRFVESVRPDPKPTLHFLHTLLPHTPWEYLPSGKKYTLPENGIRGLVGVNDRGLDPQQWANDPSAIQQAWKRHLLQVGLVDRLVGTLVDHLKKVNLFEPCLLVITADHGVSFRAQSSRRIPSQSNYPDIMAIPLFIKAPYQEKGAISDSNVETIDILPTMADILGIRLPWPTDGRSALRPSGSEKGKKIIVLESGQKLEFDPQLSGKNASIREKLAWFGTSPDDLYHAGLYRELIGRRLDVLHVAKSSVKCDLDGRTYMENVDPDSDFVLTNVCGRLIRDQAPISRPLSLAIAVNGTIRGITQSFLDPTGADRFSAVLSDTDFRPGYNQVAVYMISNAGNQLELAEVESAEIPPYQWGEVLHFSRHGNAQSYMAEGWSTPESEITWSDGSRATLVLLTSAPRNPVHLKLFTGAYVKPGRLDRQRVKVLVNRQPVADWVFSSTDFGIREVTLPQELFKDSKRTAITFEMSDSISPSAIGDGEDIRRLGLAVAWLSLSEQ